MEATSLRALALAGFAFVGCGSSASDHGLRSSGVEGQTAAATVFSDVLLAEVLVNGVAGPRLIVDTGSPVLAVTPASYPSAGVPNGNGTLASLQWGGLTFTNAPVVGADLINSPSADVPIGGILGCTILCNQSVSLNYRDAQVVVGEGAAPSAIDPPGSALAFRLEGGGTAQVQNVAGTVEFPPSRVAITATIEGTDHAFIVDTGASFVFVRAGVFATLTTDGRGQLAGLSAETVQGASTASVTRVRSIVVGGAEVKGAPAAKDTVIDGLLDGIASEVGHPVDGLIGGSFLREFYVTVDYPHRTLGLRRYATRDHIVDEFDRVGISLASPDATGRVLVAKVFPATDAAAKGVQAGDEIVAVDGKALASLSASAGARLLMGNVGSTHAIQFGVAQSPALNKTQATIRVDDLLPLP